jgi:hypothetical protein
MSDRVAAVLIDPITGLPYTAIPVNIGSTVNRTATGNITSTQNVALSTAACGSAAFQVSGTWAGTLVFEYTLDDVAWAALSVTPNGGGSAVSSTTANGNWTVQVESYSQVRVRGNTVGSGTAAIFLSASTATTVVTVAGPLPMGDNTMGRVKVTDGTNVAAVSGSGALSVDASAATVPVSNANLDVALSTLSLKNQFPTTLGATTKAGSLSVAVASDQIGTAGTAAAAVLSVQGVASMTALQVTPPAGIGQQTLANSISVGLNSSQVGTAGSAATTVLSVQGVSGGTPLPPERTTSGAPAGVTVSNFAVLILASNTSAKSRVITNNGTSNVFIGVANTVSTTGATMGIWLKLGGTYSDSGDGFYNGAIWGIGDAVSASQNVSAWERS